MDIEAIERTGEALMTKKLGAAAWPIVVHSKKRFDYFRMIGLASESESTPMALAVCTAASINELENNLREYERVILSRATTAEAVALALTIVELGDNDTPALVAEINSQAEEPAWVVSALIDAAITKRLGLMGDGQNKAVH